MSDRFSYVKKGYDPEEVEKYIETLETVIKSYKEKDSAIKNAIINAQIAADNIIRDAETASRKIKLDTIKKLEGVNASISEQKRLVQEFQEDYNKLISRYVHQFNDSEILQLYSRINELEEYIAEIQANNTKSPANTNPE